MSEFDQYKIGPSSTRALANALAFTSKCIHENSAAHEFYDENRQARNQGEMISLMHSELSECLEALREVEPPADKHLPEYPGYLVELADVVIRVLDFVALQGEADRFGEVLVHKHNFNCDRPVKHGKKF